MVNSKSFLTKFDILVTLCMDGNEEEAIGKDVLLIESVSKEEEPDAGNEESANDKKEKEIQKGNGKMKKKGKVTAAKRSLKVSLASLPHISLLQDLKENGYLYFHEFVEEDLCFSVSKAIERELGKKIEGSDANAVYQEEPSTSFSKETKKLMESFQDLVIEKLLKTLKPCQITVPKEWDDTLYGRYKKKMFFTEYHSDALNTIFERKLFDHFPDLKSTNGKRKSEKKEVVKEFYETKKLSDDVNPVVDLPIFTFWVSLCNVADEKQSHLRLHEGSHAMPDIVAKEKGKRHKGVDYGSSSTSSNPNQKKKKSTIGKIEPLNYKYKAQNFIGPEFPRGYKVGDMVLFHCLTQHEASVSKTDQIRVSIDGRLFIQLDME